MIKAAKKDDQIIQNPGTDVFIRESIQRINYKRFELVNKLLEPLFDRLVEMGFESDYLSS